MLLPCWVVACRLALCSAFSFETHDANTAIVGTAGDTARRITGTGDSTGQAVAFTVAAMLLAKAVGDGVEIDMACSFHCSVATGDQGAADDVDISIARLAISLFAAIAAGCQVHIAGRAQSTAAVTDARGRGITIAAAIADGNRHLRHGAGSSADLFSHGFALLRTAAVAARSALQIAEGIERGPDQSNTDATFTTTVTCRQRHLVLTGGDTDLLRGDGDIATAAIGGCTGDDVTANNSGVSAGTDLDIALGGTDHAAAGALRAFVAIGTTFLRTTANG